MKRRSVFILSVLAACPLMASAQPAGSEFQINSYTTGSQALPRLAARPNGGFVVVWQSAQEGGPDAPAGFVGGGTFGIFARLFSPAGRPLGPEFPVNEFTTGVQQTPAVAVAPNGEFVVVWSGYGDGGTGSYYTYPYNGFTYALGGYGIFGRRFAADGTPLGSEFQVNTYTTYYQGPFPSVAMSKSGDFVVVWKSGFSLDPSSQDGDGYGAFGRRFAADGTPLGDDFQVNTHTTGYQNSPSVASASNGNFVVVWQSPQDGDANGIIGQRFAEDGTRLGGEFQVNSFTTGNQTQPWVASASNGNFVVAWTSRGTGPGGQDGNLLGVFGQRFGASGGRLGNEFQVNTFYTGNQNQPSVAAAPNGDFVVTWSSAPGQDGDSSGVFGQAFSASGAPVGKEFQVNAYTTGNQGRSAVTVSPNGEFIVAWRSIGQDLISGQDGSSAGVFGRQFAKPKK